MCQNVHTGILEVNSTRIGKVPTLSVLSYNTMIYHLKLKATTFTNAERPDTT